MNKYENQTLSLQLVYFNTDAVVGLIFRCRVQWCIVNVQKDKYIYLREGGLLSTREASIVRELEGLFC